MLKIEVIKFEAQDVITTSVAECICDSTNTHHVTPKGHAIAGETNYETQQFTATKYCPATEHDKCPEVN